MTLDLKTVLSIGLPLLAAAAGYGALQYQVSAQADDITELKAELDAHRDLVGHPIMTERVRNMHDDVREIAAGVHVHPE